LQNETGVIENIPSAKLSLRPLDFREGREKSLISKGILPQIN
jgi:hypothetical protein